MGTGRSSKQVTENQRERSIFQIPLMQLELSDDEREALARFWSAIDADRYPLSPRLAPLKAILAKLDPQPQAHRFRRRSPARVSGMMSARPRSDCYD